MTEAEMMSECFRRAEAIVLAHRAEAPPGFDPRADNTPKVPAEDASYLQNYGDIQGAEVGGTAQGLSASALWQQKLDPILTGQSVNNVDTALFGTPGGTTKLLGRTVTTSGSPGLIATVQQANPQGYQALESLTGNALTDMASGYNLPAGLNRTVNQAVQSTNVGTLGGTGDAAAYNTALGMSQFANQQYMQRLNNLYNVMGASSSFYSPAYSLAGAATANSGVNLLQPSMNAEDIWNTGYNAQAASNIASANNAAALEAAGISSAASIAKTAAAA